MKLRRITALFCSMIIALSLLLTGCGKSASSVASDTMVIPILSDISSFFTIAGDDTLNEVLSPGFDNLFTVVDSKTTNWHLAKSCDVSDDGLTYTIKLRENLTFSDGNPLTAEDVVFSMTTADYMGYYT